LKDTNSTEKKIERPEGRSKQGERADKIGRKADRMVKARKGPREETPHVTYPVGQSGVNQAKKEGSLSTGHKGGVTQIQSIM